MGANVKDKNNKKFNKEEVINQFLDYIKIRKVVSLEDLSGTFKLNPNKIVEKLNQYEKEEKCESKRNNKRM